MATCPDGEYAKHLRTIGGLTPDKPYGTGLINVASEFDYSEWYTLCERLRTSMEASWREYQRNAMAKLEPGKFSATLKSIGDGVQAIRDRLAAMHEPWDFLELHDIGPAIDAAVTLASDTACEWQRVDEQLGAIGVDPPEKRPGIGEQNDMSILGKIALGAGAIALVGGTFWIARKVMK